MVPSADCLHGKEGKQKGVKSENYIKILDIAQYHNSTVS